MPILGGGLGNFCGVVCPQPTRVFTTNDFGGALRPGNFNILNPKMEVDGKMSCFFQLGDFLGEPAVNVPGMYTNKV